MKTLKLQDTSACWKFRANSLMAREVDARHVELPSAIGSLGDEGVHHADFRTSLELHGLTASWIPGDHSLILMIGGGQLGEKTLEPSMTVAVPVGRANELARNFSRSEPDARMDEHQRILISILADVQGVGIGQGSLARTSQSGIASVGSVVYLSTYKTNVRQIGTLDRPRDRPYVLEFRWSPHVFRVFLTAREVADLKPVLRYLPSWYENEKNIRSITLA